MQSQDDLYNIIMRVQGEADVARLTQDLRAQEEQLRQDIAAHGAYAAATRASAAAVQGTSAQLQALQGSTRNSGRAVLELSRGMEDLRYGVDGVLNNIPGLVQSLGAGAGLAGAISLAAVAGTVLYNNWGSLAGIFGQGHVKTQAEEMAELAKKTSLTADEAERLYRATALGKATEGLRNQQNKSQKAESDAVRDALVEAGPRQVAEAVRKNRPDLIDKQGDAASVLAEIEELKKRRDAARLVERATRGTAAETSSRITATDLDQQIKDMTVGVDSKLEVARRKTAEELAAKGILPDIFPGGRKELADTVRPTLPGLAKDLDAADPRAVEARKHQAAIDAMGEADAKDAKAGLDDRAKAQRDNAKAEIGSREAEERNRKKAADDARRDDEKRLKNLSDSTKNAIEQNPERQAMLEAQARAGLAGGASPLEVQQFLAKSLGGGAIAAGIAGEALSKGRGDLLRDALSGAKDEKRGSETVSGADFASKVQAGVQGQDRTAQQQLAALQTLVRLASQNKAPVARAGR